MDAELEGLLEPGNEAALETYLRLLHNSDIAKLLGELNPTYWQSLTRHLSPEDLGEVMVELDEERRARLAEQLKPERLVQAVDELESDDAADVIGDLSPAASSALLPQLEDEDEIRDLLAYPEDSAGGIMQTEICVVPEGATVAEAIEAVREVRDHVEQVLEVYVVDRMGRLYGTVSLSDLVLTHNDVAIEKIRRPIEVEVTPEVDQEEVAVLFKKYDVATLPVIDSEGVLLGRITFDDVHDVLEEEASEDILAMAGTSSDEDIVYGSQILKIVGFRLPWFATSLVGTIFVQRMALTLETTFEQAALLITFVPVVTAMSGNVGSQTAMIITRGFAIGRVELGKIARSLWREMSVGFLIGITIAAAVGAYAWLDQGNASLASTLLLSIVVSMGASATIGVLAPSSFKRLGIDPAVAAGPFVTTTCDALGVTVYVGVAYLMLGG